MPFNKNEQELKGIFVSYLLFFSCIVFFDLFHRYPVVKCAKTLLYMLFQSIGILTPGPCFLTTIVVKPLIS